MTATVLQCNGMADRTADRKTMASPLVPVLPGQVSEQIKYVVFITKENHTYDTVFDRVPGLFPTNSPNLLAQNDFATW